MPDINTTPTLEAVLTLIQDTSDRNAQAVKDAFEHHEKVTEERDKYQRLQFNVMNGKIDSFIHEAACKDNEQKEALAEAIRIRKSDFQEYKAEVDGKLDGFQGDLTVVSARVDVLENAPDKETAHKVRTFWAELAKWALPFIAGTFIMWLLFKLGVKFS